MLVSHNVGLRSELWVELQGFQVFKEFLPSFMFFCISYNESFAPHTLLWFLFKRLLVTSHHKIFSHITIGSLLCLLANWSNWSFHSILPYKPLQSSWHGWLVFVLTCWTLLHLQSKCWSLYSFSQKSVEECPFLGSVRGGLLPGKWSNSPPHPNITLHYFICNALSNNKEHDNKQDMIEKKYVVFYTVEVKRK